jgi:hypothetical protein
MRYNSSRRNRKNLLFVEDATIVPNGIDATAISSPIGPAPINAMSVDSIWGNIDPIASA